MAVGSESEYMNGDVFLILYEERANGSHSCCPRLCVDKMAPRPSAAAIMAACCREGEERRCRWGWGAAGSAWFSRTFLISFPALWAPDLPSVSLSPWEMVMLDFLTARPRVHVGGEGDWGAEKEQDSSLGSGGSERRCLSDRMGEEASRLALFGKRSVRCF